MDHGHLHHVSVGVDPSSGAGGGERFPQWSVQETGEFLMIRAELDPRFMEIKRNKLLWEVISRKMKERGYNRSAEQCKAKWKNLVTRYKGCETVEDDSVRQQFPFYNDLDAIFTARMQRMLWTETEGSKKRMMPFSSDDDEESDLEKTKKKKVAIKSSNIGTYSNTKEILGEFMKQQMQIEKQWMKAFEEKEEERRSKEMEWRQTMMALEKERMMLDQRWREKEEQRMMREEVRSQKRDALFTALFNMLARQDL
ncbi:unnamed protein product [Lactuca saligna]|uniref:Myb-like domain-containing protein n=1 Tax=Lactuca saligna TaxID=75948 RepID=A0AA35ZUL9_LACSI|nr:unnamed protein product [Lactuca saligna]